MQTDRPTSLLGKVAIVTGAVGLLGKEHCRALARAGARVVATDVDPVAAAGIAAELEDRFGTEAIGVGADVTRPDDVRGLRDRVLERFDRVDVLVNNAAIDDKFERGEGSGLSRFEVYPLEQWRRVLDVNVTGVFLCCQVIGAEMVRRGSGSIVNVASTYGIVSPDQRLYAPPTGPQTFFKGPAYPTSKAAVLQLTRFLACYWGESGVRVNALSPGGVENGQAAHFRAAYAARTPLGRMARPTDYAGALLFLASDDSAYMTGHNLVVDGGWTAW
jgi:NAD(P)-dependent dehydrogenase (short-subunit alcohol dehydrogenase family)